MFLSTMGMVADKTAVITRLQYLFHCIPTKITNLFLKNNIFTNFSQRFKIVIFKM